MNTPSTTFSAGLEGVIACATRLSHVDGSAGRLIFAGHNAVKLAETKTVEEVWFLLHEGRLPTAEELTAFRTKVETLGKLSRAEVNLVKRARGTEPLSAFRTAISAIACHRGFKPWLNREVAEVEQEVLQLQSLAPSIVEILHTGKAPVRKTKNKGYAERYLWGVTGKRPSAADLRAVETYLILTIDHGLNASTFSGRVTASTGADVGAAITAAVGTLPDLCTAVRPVLFSICSIRSARPRTQLPGSSQSCPVGGASWASVTASTAPTTRVLSACAVWRRSRTGRALPWLSKWRRKSSPLSKPRLKPRHSPLASPPALCV